MSRGTPVSHREPAAEHASWITSPARARRGVVLFLVLIPALVALPLFLRLRFGGPAHPRFDYACLIGLTWAPALACLIARAIRREGLGDVSFGFALRRDARWLAVAIAAPLAVMLIGYGAAWGSSLAPFTLPPAAPWPGADPATRFAGFALSNLGRGIATWLLLALGEEIGWRGYLLPRLIDAGVRRPVLLSGIIWGFWHVPSVLWGSYPAGPNRPLSAAIILVTLGAFALALARMRLETGSIWPVVLSHAFWNS
ncbi:MAG TPA: type II CAAX endopeptidase family protein, partial [Candidatus Udaeobacter sp.]|nr:type II CAAX endopeptidase family protein [Candidatus Udaeobacter sp.]